MRKREDAYKQAKTMIAAGNLNGAYTVLDTTIAFDTGVAYDSAYYLHSDLNEINNSANLEEHALELEKTTNGWQTLIAGKFSPEYLHFPSSIKWATPPLLRERKLLPGICVQRKEDEKLSAAMRLKEAKAIATEAKAAAVSLAREPIEKRIKAGRTCEKFTSIPIRT